MDFRKSVLVVRADVGGRVLVKGSSDSVMMVLSDEGCWSVSVCEGESGVTGL